jgi:hypothetical protein
MVKHCGLTLKTIRALKKKFKLSLESKTLNSKLNNGIIFIITE